MIYQGYSSVWRGLREKKKMVLKIMHISNMELLFKNNILMAIPPFQRKGEFGAGYRLRTTGRTHFNVSGLVYLSCLITINKRLINILSKKMCGTKENKWNLCIALLVYIAKCFKMKNIS